ncbi:hypothetical protein BS17DRAFT_809135 [Gyrodon lividus]|nr:hypothetical protein BS17DRAFT_809135 [Gyrodon lividus]
MPQLKTLTGESALAFLLIHDPEHAQHLGFHIPLKSKQSLSVAETAASTAEDEVHDLPATLTVKTTSQPGETLAQDIVVTTPTLSLAFRHTGAFSYPSFIPHPLQDCENFEGTLYLRGQNPELGSNGFNAQQYPPYLLLDGKEQAPAGRVTIDFWTDDRIIGVVVSLHREVNYARHQELTPLSANVDNYISGGNGTWVPINA